MSEDLDSRIDRAIDREVGCIEAGGAGCDNKRRCLARAVGGIAAGDRVDLAGCPATRGADFFRRIDVDFVGSVGKTDRADVTLWFAAS